MCNVKNQTQIYKALCQGEKADLWPGKSNDNFGFQPHRILGRARDPCVLGIQMHKYIVYIYMQMRQNVYPCKINYNFL